MSELRADQNFAIGVDGGTSLRIFVKQGINIDLVPFVWQQQGMNPTDDRSTKKGGFHFKVGISPTLRKKSKYHFNLRLLADYGETWFEDRIQNPTSKVMESFRYKAYSLKWQLGPELEAFVGKGRRFSVAIAGYISYQRWRTENYRVVYDAEGAGEKEQVGWWKDWNVTGPEGGFAARFYF